MEPEPVENTEEHSQRVLAAIVFTDVVGFSHRTGREEDATIQAVRRELGIMSNACRNHGGQVLKNTGDGLLMCFQSAIQALTCAIQIQEELTRLNSSVPAENRLQHRIGVHLGDVITTEDDVYGDGVNVAARLQQEAKPDTILFSRTVYDVVKNKMTIDASYLGPRTLKGIAEPVMVWQILSPSVTRSHEEAIAKVGELLREPATSTEPGISGRRAVLYVMASILALGVPIILFLTMFRPGGNLARDTQGPTLMDKLRKRIDGSAEQKPVASPQASAPNANPTPDAEEQMRALLVTPEIEAARRDFLRTYDFQGLVQWLKAQGYGDKPGGARLIARYESLAAFLLWFKEQVSAATEENPIVGNNDPAMPGEYKVWAGQNGSLSFVSATGSGEQPFASIPPKTLLAVARSAYAKSQSSASAIPESQAGQWFQLFSEEFP